MRATWTELLERFVTNQPVGAAELSEAFHGTGLAPIEDLPADQAATDIPIVAARLAAIVDTTRTVTEHECAAIELIEHTRNWHEAQPGEPIHPLLWKWAVLLGGAADVGALLIRCGCKPKLTDWRNDARLSA